MIALNSKTYYAWGQKDKVSTKGLSKTINNMGGEDFERVLATKNKGGGVNRGFVVKNNSLILYEQQRDALNYFYPKRQVQEDGISTMPLLI